eukprot:3298856-Rhodomonas_salina.2
MNKGMNPQTEACSHKRRCSRRKSAANQGRRGSKKKKKRTCAEVGCCLHRLEQTQLRLFQLSLLTQQSTVRDSSTRQGIVPHATSVPDGARARQNTSHPVAATQKRGVGTGPVQPSRMLYPQSVSYKADYERVGQFGAGYQLPTVVGSALVHT